MPGEGAQELVSGAENAGNGVSDPAMPPEGTTNPDTSSGSEDPDAADGSNGISDGSLSGVVPDGVEDAAVSEDGGVSEEASGAGPEDVLTEGGDPSDEADGTEDEEDAEGSEGEEAGNGEAEAEDVEGEEGTEDTVEEAVSAEASLLAVAAVLDTGAPNTWNQVGGSWYWYDSQGLRADKGWVVTDVALPGSSSSGLQRYWLGDGGVLSFSSLITDVTAGWIAYATSSGYVVRGSYTDAATGYVYLANNDGVLENPGWLVTSAYSDDGQLQRYWIDAESHACEPGYSSDGWDHYTTDAGYVARGSYTDQDTGYVYLANNDGLLESPGWVVTSAYSGDGQLQRYYVDAESHACEPGYSGDGWAHYTTSRGYVLRGSWDTGYGRIYIADNDGRLLNNGVGGWVVTGAFSNGELQRYFVDPTDHAVRSGEFEVTEDESSVLNGLFWGQANVGYVTRNTCIEIGTRWYQADNEGLLTYLVTGKVGYQNPSQYYQLSAYDVVSSSPNAGIFSYVSPSLIRPDSVRSACVEAFISRAYDYLGTTYIWDYACAPGVGVDCAGLVLQCLYAVGMDVDYNYTPYDHYYTPGHDQYANAMRNDDKFMTVNVADRQRGDLICYEGHIAIYLGGDAVINAYPPNVHVQSIWDFGTILAVKRVFI